MTATGYRFGTTGLAALVAAAALACGAQADCTCAKAKISDGWCGDCKVGYVDGVQLPSKKLFEALAGKPVDPETIKCSTCRAAAETDGFCEKCGTGFVRNHAFHSAIAWKLARGKTTDPKTIRCSTCRKAAEDHGWCEECNKGLVGARVFTDREQYDKAVKARQVLVEAARTARTCEGCAVAMVTDGTCTACGITYKHGKPQRTTP